MKLKDYLKTCDEVVHTTLDPEEPGVCRLHLVPPKNPKPGTPWVVIINGYSVLPLSSAWAVLLKLFLSELNLRPGVLRDEDVDALVSATIKQAKEIFPGVKDEEFKRDLSDMLATFRALAVGKEPKADLGYMTLSAYARHMSAPHRMDLMISSLRSEGRWHCNQHCLHCYANEPLAMQEELTTEEWFAILDKCKKACIPAVTFTGGEPTMRKDLVALVEHAKWFVTRLNTNGILLTKELCAALAKASLDSVQVTLYSHDESVHNTLVGGEHFKETVQGIRNALEAGLDVSINTPLCSLNADYEKTVEFARSLGLRYLSSSGLIPAGNAKGEASKGTALTRTEITAALERAREYAIAHEMELSFTSPGWIAAKTLKSWNMVVPSCGACLSNMAISPNGSVLPCQSWLGGETLGSMLTDDWKKIWKGKRCKEIRARSAKEKHVCLLKEGV